MNEPDLASNLIAAAGVIATTVVAVAAFVTSRAALKMQRLTVGLQGRELAAADIARWARNAGSTIEAMHNPESWRVPRRGCVRCRDGDQARRHSPAEPSPLRPSSRKPR